MTRDGQPIDSFSGVQSPHIFISAAEPSGDLHAASLISAIRQICPGGRFTGVAGPRMQAAGCTPIDDLTQRSAMLVGALRLAGHAWKLLGRVEQLAVTEQFDLAILVDSPTLHLPMAARLKRSGRRVLYYIAPQLWAWAPWRIGKVRRRVDRLAVILPFEEEYFRSRGVRADFVGHPLVEQLGSIRTDEQRVQAYRAEGSPVIACLPGSRRHVVEEVLPGQIEVARAIAAAHPHALFLFSAAGATAREMIAGALGGAGFNYRIVEEGNAEILAAADLALCASGTATLEVAWHGVPMVVMYNGSKWGYRIVGRHLVRTPHLSLPNILAGRRIVPEFMPYYTSTAPIADAALEILGDETRRERIRADLRAVIVSLGSSPAASRTASIALDMVAGRA